LLTKPIKADIYVVKKLVNIHGKLGRFYR